MFNKWGKYSYTDQKNRNTRIRNFALRVAAVVFVYILLTNFFFPMVVMESDSMQPSIKNGERFVFFALNVPGKWGSVTYKRGNIVIVNMSDKNNFFITIADRVFRFFTVGKIGFPGKENRTFIKRIIGLPGDEISMANYVIQVHPSDSLYTLTESEVSDGYYQIDIPQLPPLWSDSIPLGGNMSSVVLGDDECFVLSDDRSNTNDSRTWGPVKTDRIKGKVLFRYWPFSRVGIP
jgi:signal peptidase I